MITPSSDTPYRPTVFVIQDMPRKNTSSLIDFGNPVAVLSEEDEARMLNIPMIVFKIRRALQRITPHDYLVLMGNPVSIGIATAVAAEITGGRFKLLKWDNHDHRYFPVSVDLNKQMTNG